VHEVLEDESAVMKNVYAFFEVYLRREDEIRLQ
jgi:hypothetical protein